MTPQELYDAVDERRRHLNLPWWRIAIQLGSDTKTLRWMKTRGYLSDSLRARVVAWLGEAS